MGKPPRFSTDLCIAVLASSAAAAAAAELPLTTNAEGRVAFGDGQLCVVFDPASSLPSEIDVDGETLFVEDGFGSVEIALMGAPDGATCGFEAEGRSVERVSDDTVRGILTVGSWRIEGYVQLVPEERAVRRWFSFEWTGAEDVKFSGLTVRMGMFPCRTGKGSYILPGFFAENRWPRSAWREGVTRDAMFGSESPVIAEDGDGRSVLACVDCLRPYSDRSQHQVTERAGGLSISVQTRMCGVAHPGRPQMVGDFWLKFDRCGAEESLRRMHSWHRLVGHLPPSDRPAWVRDLVLYSTHPYGRGMYEPGGFPHAREYIPFIDALGANAIWLRPVEHAGMYGPDEMYRLQDGIGTDADHLAYVRDAHIRGIRVLRDAVMHGGKTSNRRTREHPEWVCLKEDGSQQDTFWAYDYLWPSWVEYFSAYIEAMTRKYELDGWRLDVPKGSRFPNWNPGIPYERASYAQHQGGIAQMRAIRAAMKKANPDSCTLAEANPSYCSVLNDAIYDQNLCHAYFHWLNDHPVEDVARWLSQWLEDQKNSFVPDTVWMRYPESHDAYPCDEIWGRSAANALMALCAWIDGFPLVMNESEDGAFEAYRRIFSIRRTLPELTRGSADYLSVKAPPGVFACRRSLPDSESVIFVNLNGHRVSDEGLDLPPFGYKVIRTRGPSVESCMGGVAERPFANKSGNGRTEFSVELRDMTNGLVRASYRIKEERSAAGTHYHVADFGGIDPAKVRLVVRMPDCGRWYAHCAEGSFESPFLVRHPRMDTFVSRYKDRLLDGARRWDSRQHPFGFTREHAAVGGVDGDSAYECFGFAPDADVMLWDRLGDETGLAVSVSGTNAAAYSVTCTKLPTANALRERDPGTGDARLTPAMGGWLYDDGILRLRIRRTGAIAGMWGKGEDGAWREIMRSFGARGRSPDAPDTPRQIWGGRDPDAREQAFSPSPYARFLREGDGALRLFFDGGEVRGIERNSGRMPKPISTRTSFSLGGGSYEMVLLSHFDAERYGKDDWSVELVAGLPDDVKSGNVAASSVFTGCVPWKTVRDKDALRFVYHSPGSPDFITPTNRWCGVSLRLDKLVATPDVKDKCEK